MLVVRGCCCCGCRCGCCLDRVVSYCFFCCVRFVCLCWCCCWGSCQQLLLFSVCCRRCLKLSLVATRVLVTYAWPVGGKGPLLRANQWRRLMPTRLESQRRGCCIRSGRRFQEQKAFCCTAELCTLALPCLYHGTDNMYLCSAGRCMWYPNSNRSHLAMNDHVVKPAEKQSNNAVVVGDRMSLQIIIVGTCARGVPYPRYLLPPPFRERRWMPSGC